MFISGTTAIHLDLILLATRKYIYSYHKQHLSNLKDIDFLEELPGFYSYRWLTTLTLSKNSKINREDLRLGLLKENIESRSLFKPMHLQPVLKKHQSFKHDVSEDLFNTGLCLPSESNIDDNDLQRIVNNAINIYES